MENILTQIFANPLLTFIFLAINFLWLLILSFFTFSYVFHYKKLIRGVEKGDLKKILGEHLKKIKMVEKNLVALKDSVSKMQKADLTHFQKVGVVRFNPFSDTGGDQSFAIALLDGEGNGLVVSTLHGREETRIYGKPVKGGKEDGYSFSEEEKKAIKKALGQK